MTTLDQYVLVCFTFMVIVLIENVAFPAIQHQASEDFVQQGTYMCACTCTIYVCVYVYPHICMCVYLSYSLPYSTRHLKTSCNKVCMCVHARTLYTYVHMCVSTYLCVCVCVIYPTKTRHLKTSCNNVIAVCTCKYVHNELMCVYIYMQKFLISV
jgi:hypothetical protein